MFLNYLIIAMRNFLKHKFYSMINITGLGIGIACVILILLFIKDQYSYDHQQVNGSRIYKVLRELSPENGQKTYEYGISGGAGPALSQDFPEIEATVRLMPRQVWIQHKDKILSQIFCLADPNILDVFNFPMLRGDKTALSQPQSVFITESAAKKYFGNQDPMGQTVSVEGSYVAGDYTISGIIRDTPKHSTFQFDFLSSSVSPNFKSWNEFTPLDPLRVISVYVLLKKGASASVLESKLSTFIERHMGPDVAKSVDYSLQPFNDIYLYSAKDYGIRGTDKRDDGIAYGDIRQVYTASFVAFFVLLIACINFTNLTTARSANRAKEVGLRKVIGANRSHLAIQFLGESFLLTVMSLVVALCMMELLLPLLNTYTGNQLAFHFTSDFIFQLVGLVLLVSLIAGSYPAFYLSRFHPIGVLKGALATGAKHGALRKLLVIFQFSISVVLMVTTILVIEQTHYIRSKNLGFDRDNIVELPIFWEHRNSSEKNHALWLRYEEVKQAFLQNPNIKAATVSRFPQGSAAPTSTFMTYQGGPNEWRMRLNEVDEDFIPTFNIELVSGRNFSENATFQGLVASHRIVLGVGRTPGEKSSSTDRIMPESEYILNETAVKMLGWTDPIGKKFGIKGQMPGKVVGVVKDFNVRSLREPMQPVVLFASTGVAKTLFLKISPEHFGETVAFMKKTWERFLPTRPFTYTFLDERLNQLYKEENQFSETIGIFSLLTIFVASLGLLGLISFMAEQRKKEVGIRKVFGASEITIVGLLCSESLKLVLIACLVAFPVAYVFVDRWLQGFAYRIGITVWPFAIGGLCSLILSLAIVMFQTLKAARTNPIDALRYE